MKEKGMAIMGTGSAKGENRAVEAATFAISSPLLENIKIDGATGIIINVTGGSDLSLYEVNEASTLITEAAHEDAEIIFGAVIDDSLGDEVRVTVIATGFNEHEEKKNSVQDAFTGMQNFLNTAPIQMPALNIPPPSINPAMSSSAGLNFELPPISAVQNSVNQFTHEAMPTVEEAPVMQQQQVQYAQPVQQAQPQFPMQPSVIQAPVVPVQAHQPVVQQQPSVPQPQMMAHEVAPSVISPNESLLNARDMLMAKARAFKESQDLKSKHVGPEQLSMMMENESASLEEARKMARDVLSSSFHGQNLDVPSFIRKRQSMDSDHKSE
jgi:cell division protein FtsZ